MLPELFPDIGIVFRQGRNCAELAWEYSLSGAHESEQERIHLFDNSAVYRPIWNRAFQAGFGTADNQQKQKHSTVLQLLLKALQKKCFKLAFKYISLLFVLRQKYGYIMSETWPKKTISLSLLSLLLLTLNILFCWYFGLISACPKYRRACSAGEFPRFQIEICLKANPFVTTVYII